jgi:hypothetical protein
MRLLSLLLLSLLLIGSAFAEDEFEKGAFLGADGEAAMDGAIAYGYAQVGRYRSLTVGTETTTVIPGGQFEAGCAGTSTNIGTTTLPGEGDSPEELNLTTVVMGDVVTLDLGCR